MNIFKRQKHKIIESSRPEALEHAIKMMAGSPSWNEVIEFIGDLRLMAHDSTATTDVIKDGNLQKFYVGKAAALTELLDYIETQTPLDEG